MAEQKYLYRSFIRTLAKRFEASVSYIQAIYGFDYGDEFEIAICKTLRAALPQRYGICRGHVVNRKDEAAGDDIIVYDSFYFPTLRLLGAEDFSRKEWIPIEAVYAYIEAKHTLHLQGDLDDNSSLAKAASQIQAVKKLISQRQSVPFEEISRGFRVPAESFARSPAGLLPNTRNPLFAAIMARRVALKADGNPITSGVEVGKLLKGVKLPDDFPPDLVVLGPSTTLIPTLKHPTEELGACRLFYQPDTDMDYTISVNKDVAFGIGLATLLAALDYIQLGQMPWFAVLDDVLMKQDVTRQDIHQAPSSDPKSKRSKRS